MDAPIEFHGGQSSVSDAIGIGWMALREVMRAWRVTTPEELSTWLRNRGFPATRPGQHLSVRAQEFIFHEGCVLDARVAMLETAFVSITLEQGRASGIPPVSNVGRSATRRTATSAIPPVVPPESWEQLDEVDQSEWFLARIPMLKSCPHFLRGRLRQCWAVALRERHRARQVHDNAAEERAWKLFGLVPVMLLHRPRGSGSVGRDELAQRADDFARGHWIALLHNARRSVVEVRGRIAKSEAQEQARRGRAALSRVQQGQVSRARQELTGADLAPKTLDTLAELQGRRPQVRGMDIPQDVMEFVPDRPVQLDLTLFTKCLRNAPSGSASGPGGCTNEMLRVCLDDHELFQLLFRAAEDFATADMPEPVRKAFMSATMTALQKPDGGVRGIATGTSFRRLVSRTLARQFGKAVEATCAPFQFALSTRAGTDCVGHAIRALTDANPLTTILSIDGIGAYDHVYRSAFLKKLLNVPSLQGLLPFVRATYADPTSYAWVDEAGEVHHIVQAEGGEQGDPLMPLLFSSAIHDPLEEASRELRPEEHLFAYLDDVYFSGDVPNRTRTVYDSLGEKLFTQAGIRLHSGKTRVWNRASVCPEGMAEWDPRCGTQRA